MKNTGLKFRRCRMEFFIFVTLMILFQTMLVGLCIHYYPKTPSVTEQLNISIQTEPQEEPVPYEYYSPIKLTESERLLVEGVVFAEHGNGTLEEQKAVAQVIHNRALLWGMTVEDVVTAPKQFASPKTENIPPITKVAVSEIFDFGMMQFDGHVTHFYNYNQCSPDWASSMVEVGRGNAHRFMVKMEDMQ